MDKQTITKIWMDHLNNTNESFGWRWQMVKQTAPYLLGLKIIKLVDKRKDTSRPYPLVLYFPGIYPFWIKFCYNGILFLASEWKMNSVDLDLKI